MSFALATGPCCSAEIEKHPQATGQDPLIGGADEQKTQSIARVGAFHVAAIAAICLRSDKIKNATPKAAAKELADIGATLRAKWISLPDAKVSLKEDGKILIEEIERKAGTGSGSKQTKRKDDDVLSMSSLFEEFNPNKKKKEAAEETQNAQKKQEPDALEAGQARKERAAVAETSDAAKDKAQQDSADKEEKNNKDKKDQKDDTAEKDNKEKKDNKDKKDKKGKKDKKEKKEDKEKMDKKEKQEKKEKKEKKERKKDKDKKEDNKEKLAQTSARKRKPPHTQAAQSEMLARRTSPFHLA